MFNADGEKIREEHHSNMFGCQSSMEG
jgi:hypothetical protein